MQSAIIFAFSILRLVALFIFSKELIFAVTNFEFKCLFATTFHVPISRHMV